MAVKDNYTTAEKVLKESLEEPKEWNETYLAEKDKIIISNETMLLAELLERLCNRLERV